MSGWAARFRGCDYAEGGVEPDGGGGKGVRGRGVEFAEVIGGGLCRKTFGGWATALLGVLSWAWAALLVALGGVCGCVL